MKTSRSLLGGYALFVALGLVDLGVTWYLLQISGGHIYESNPVARWWLDRWGWAGLVGFKLGLIVLATSAIALVARWRPRAAAGTLAFSCAATFAVIVYSCTLFRAIPRYAQLYPVRDDATVEAEGRRFDELIRQGNLYRAALDQAAGDFLLGRCTLEAGVARLAATPKGRDRAWLDKLREVYPGSSDTECLIASLLDRARALLREKPDEYGAAGARLRLGFALTSAGRSGEGGSPQEVPPRRSAAADLLAQSFSAGAVATN
jgi:hypothetical protein